MVGVFLMKKQGFLIAVFATLSIVLLPIPSQALEQMPVLTLNDSNHEPFTTKNNDGFTDIVLKEIFRRIGFRVNTVQLPPERGLLSANDGIIDGEVNRIAGLNKLYKNLVRVPEKIRDSEFCALSKDATIINTPDELNKRVVGHIKGWKIYDKMMEKSAKVITANSPQQLFQLLKINRIEVALYACAEGIERAKRLDMKDIHVLKPLFSQTELFIYLNKRHSSLVPKLGKALYDFKKEGLYMQLYREKILPYYK